MIRLEKLNKYFYRGRQKEIHVINDVSLELPERGMTAIFGKSGCGKTTLLNVIGGLDGFSSGSLTVEGKSIRRNTDTVRNRYIGYIFQNYNLLANETCFENVADALRLCGIKDKKTIRERVTAALKNVGMEKFARRTPDTLSGGQQQRIAIARAIVKNPKIILADEPTGNLDEANTVLVMDLLKEISRDHLVLLVTHEESLVSHYCDTVIALSDGKVVEVRKNEDVGGYTARDKNRIYLGELEKTELSDENAAISYYGAPPETPVRLRIVNRDGKIFLRVDTEGVQVLDDSCELRLTEGVYREETHREEQPSARVDMSALPPVEGKHFGKLFTLGSALKSAYRIQFGKQKAVKRIFRVFLAFFALLVVFMSAVFGTVFGDLADMEKKYNPNVFYLYTVDGVSEKLREAVANRTAGIDAVYLERSFYPADETFYFLPHDFETFSELRYSSLSASAAILPYERSSHLDLVAGRRQTRSEGDLLITTAMADELLADSPADYISEYGDLIGMRLDDYRMKGEIVGVVASRERAIYFDELALAKLAYSSARPSRTELGSAFGVSLSAGETVLLVDAKQDKASYPSEGETVMIQGKELLVKEKIVACGFYRDWQVQHGIHLPEPDETSSYEYYDEYYADYGTFLQEQRFFLDSDYDLWLYAVKGVEEAMYVVAEPLKDYYYAKCFYKEYGRYPTKADGDFTEDYPSPEVVLAEYREQYFEEYANREPLPYVDYSLYLVSNSDYIEFSKYFGETDPSAMPDTFYGGKDGRSDDEYEYGYFDTPFYTVIHTTNPHKTEKWLKAEFGSITPPEDVELLRTPFQRYSLMLVVNMVGIVTSLVALGVLLLVMCVSMYFMMRASLLERIREIGIYRAIGVSRRNLLFRFFMEAATLFSLTVFPGYLAESLLLSVLMKASTVMPDLFFYPPWYALLVLLFLAAVSLFFGVLPILSVLRKRPSAILAKYDI